MYVHPTDASPYSTSTLTHLVWEIFRFSPTTLPPPQTIRVILYLCSRYVSFTQNTCFKMRENSLVYTPAAAVLVQHPMENKLTNSLNCFVWWNLLSKTNLFLFIFFLVFALFVKYARDAKMCFSFYRFSKHNFHFIIHLFSVCVCV